MTVRACHCQLLGGERNIQVPTSSQKWIVVAAIVAAALVGWVQLQHSSIWYDEAITLLTTSGHAKLNWALGMKQFKPSADLGKIASELYEQDVHPPLYFWTLAIWRVAFGESLEVARCLSLLFTLALLALLHWVALDLGMKWAAVPVVVYALSAAGLRYAYDARPYAMAVFLIVLTLYLANKRSKWAGVCAAASIATHYFAALCVGPILLLGIAQQWKSNRRWVWLTSVTFVACLAPLLPLLRIHVRARPLQYTGFGSFPRELWALLKGAMEGVMPSTWLPHWGYALLLGAVFAVVGAWWAYRHNKSPFVLVYPAFLVGFLVLAMATNKSILQMPVDYYTGVAAPLLALLIAFGVEAEPRGSLALGLAFLVGTATHASMTKSVDYRRMAAEMRSECGNCPVLVGVGYVGAIPACVLYEAKGMKVWLLNQDDTVDSAWRRMDEPQKFFLVPSNEPATTAIEHEMERALAARQGNGYVELDTNPQLQAGEYSAPREMRSHN
jgi:4-amino-4-deoxy-L-arabinose transferase-like glycosyltransferase